MTTCCTHNCEQGRNCPLRVARRKAVTPLVWEVIAWIAKKRSG